MSKLQQTIAKANEYGLYALLFAQPITGLSRGQFHGQPFEVLIWNVPTLLEPKPAISILFAEAHEFGAKALLVLYRPARGRRAFPPSGLARWRAATDVAAEFNG
jgi:cytochrome b561